MIYLMPLWDDPEPYLNSNFGFFSRDFWENFKHYFLTLEEKDGNYVIETDMPGFNKEEINITSKKGCLQISAKNEKVSKKRIFSAKYSLPEGIDSEVEPEAKYENGVLTLSFGTLKDKGKKGLEKKIEVK